MQIKLYYFLRYKELNFLWNKIFDIMFSNRSVLYFIRILLELIEYYYSIITVLKMKMSGKI